MCMQQVAQADVLHPPLVQPIFSFWSPIPTRTRTITAQLQGNQILPFPAYQEQATLGAIKSTLSNVAIFVSLDAAIPSTAGDVNTLVLHACTSEKQPFPLQMISHLQALPGTAQTAVSWPNSILSSVWVPDYC